MTFFIKFIRPIAGAVGEDFIFMDNNAWPNRARIVNDYLKSETIQHMGWPSSSFSRPEPMKHAWDISFQLVQHFPKIDVDIPYELHSQG